MSESGAEEGEFDQPLRVTIQYNNSLNDILTIDTYTHFYLSHFCNPEKPGQS